MKSAALGLRAGMLILLLPLVSGMSLAQVPLGTTTSGSAATFSRPVETVRSLVDYRGIVNVSKKLSDFLELNSELPGSVAPAALTAVVARNNLRAVFKNQESQAFLSAAKDSPLLKSSLGANAAALAYFTRGQAAEALACLLVIVDRTPQDSSALLNLAAAALAFRQANEAMALLAEAEKFVTPPDGASTASDALRTDYLKAYALMLRGDYSAARRLLVPVVATAPALNAAALTLALVESKLGEDPRKSYLQGVWRTRVRLLVKDVPVPTTEAELDRQPDGYSDGNSVTPALADLYDVTGGRAGHLRVLRVPNSPAEVRAFVQVYGPLIAKDHATAAGFREQMAAQQMKFEQSSLPKLYKERMRQLYQKSDEVELASPAGARAVRERRYRYDHYVKQVKKIRDATMAAQMEITLTYTIARRSRAEIDAALDAEALKAISQLASSLRSYLRAIGEKFALESQFLHGMMRHVGVPALREAMIAEGEFIRLTRQLEQLDAIYQLVPMVALGQPAEIFAFEEGGKGNREECSDEDAKWTLSVDARIFEVEVSCRSVSMEVQATLGLIGVSGEVGYEMGGTVTGYIGPKGSLEGVGSAKGGLYITATREGIQDFGGKIETKASAGIGPVKINRLVDEKAISFIPGPAEGDAPNGLPVFKTE